MDVILGCHPRLHPTIHPRDGETGRRPAAALPWTMPLGGDLGFNPSRDQTDRQTDGRYNAHSLAARLSLWSQLRFLAWRSQMRAIYSVDTVRTDGQAWCPARYSSLYRSYPPWVDVLPLPWWSFGGGTIGRIIGGEDFPSSRISGVSLSPRDRISFLFGRLTNGKVGLNKQLSFASVCCNFYSKHIFDDAK